MTKFVVNPYRHDPYKAFKFKVIWDGKTIPGISKINGLNRTTEALTYREGSDSSNLQTTPGITSFTPIVLERGITHDTSFEDWANMVYHQQGDNVMSLKNYRKDIAIQLLNLQGVVVISYQVFNCWVSEYQPISPLNAENCNIATEKLVLHHAGWERDLAITEPEQS